MDDANSGHACRVGDGSERKLIKVIFFNAQRKNKSIFFSTRNHATYALDVGII